MQNANKQHQHISSEMLLYRKKRSLHGQHYVKNERGLNNNDYLFWQLLESLQRECRQTFHSIIGP